MQKSLLLFFTIFLILVNNVSAHSILESNYPKDGDQVSSVDLKEVTLNFEAKIEEGSKLILVNETGAIMPVEVNVEEQKIVAKLQEPLEPGNYSVMWEAASTDGHLLNGTFAFEVTGDQITKEETTNESKVDQTEQDNAMKNNDEENQKVKENNQKQDSSNSVILYGVIGLLVIALIVSVLFMKRK